MDSKVILYIYMCLYVRTVTACQAKVTLTRHMLPANTLSKWAGLAYHLKLATVERARFSFQELTENKVELKGGTDIRNMTPN